MGAIRIVRCGCIAWPDAMGTAPMGAMPRESGGVPLVDVLLLVGGRNTGGRPALAEATSAAISTASLASSTTSCFLIAAARATSFSDRARASEMSMPAIAIV
ncbi:MAG: hypothetical protein JKX97_00490 [Candidatus Lindowbacteria bacterium]|nr:hypothetical protein [Candidatus Lindowbacteria bacterium]